jgi:hypothetical protein
MSSKWSSKRGVKGVVKAEKGKRGSKTKLLSAADIQFGSWISKGIDRGE